MYFKNQNRTQISSGLITYSHTLYGISFDTIPTNVSGIFFKILRILDRSNKPLYDFNVWYPLISHTRPKTIEGHNDLAWLKPIYSLKFGSYQCA